ncbi:FRG domain-containing protein [Luteolibacter marinus]|uniref:FRG domain-containing protein n=1 Tax=Luteolibacter marinus TaxID=2776705 RepID=UPI001865DEF5|nr:FRG domain-containing protein [Luteolibacter marinus]
MHNLKTFLTEADTLKQQIGASIKSCWYRGQSNPWDLDCSLARFYRENTDVDSTKLAIHPIEESLYCDYSNQSDGLNGGARNSWDTLASMQHYGVPTRLLDWSESFLVACFFALEKTFDPIKERLIGNHDPTIFFLNPYKLSSHSARSDTSTLPETYFKDSRKIWNVTLSKNLDYLENVVINKNWHFNSPLPIYPPRNNLRIVAQQGCFTVHGLSMDALNHQKSSRDSLRQISIRDHRVAKEIWQLIQLHNISEHYIYRDLDRLGSHVKSRHKPLPNKRANPTA